MKLNDKVNVNEIIVSALLIVVGFGVYYLLFYPQLVLQYETKYWRTPSSSVEKNSTETCSLTNDDGIGILNFKLKFPKYMADFIDRDINLKIENKTDKYQKGLLLIESQLVTKKNLNPAKNSSIDLIIDEERREYLEFNLPPCSTQTFEILAIVPRYDYAQNLYALFTFSFHEINDQDGLAAIPEILVWDLVSNTCEVEDKDEKNNGELICAEVKPDQVFLHTAIENLLLPPWSNGLIPIFIFAAVWISARVSQNSKSRIEQDFKLFEFANILVLSVFFITIFAVLIWCTFFVQGFDISSKDYQNIVSGLLILSALPLLGGIFFKKGVVQITLSLKNFTKIVWIILISFMTVYAVNQFYGLISQLFNFSNMKLIKVGFILLILPYAIRGIFWVLYIAFDFIEVPICNGISRCKKGIQAIYFKFNQKADFYKYANVIKVIVRPIRSIKALVAQKRALETNSKEDWELVIKAFPDSPVVQTRLMEIYSKELETELRSISSKMGIASKDKNPAIIDQLFIRLDELFNDDKYRDLLAGQYDERVNRLEKAQVEILEFISRFNWFVMLNKIEYAYEVYNEIRDSSETPYFIDDKGLFGEKGTKMSVEDTDSAMHIKYLQWLQEEIQLFLEFCSQYKSEFPDQISEKSQQLIDLIDNLPDEDKRSFTWWRGLLV